MSKVVERFLRYAAMDTQSEDEREAIPSTEKQRLFAELLLKNIIKLKGGSLYILITVQMKHSQKLTLHRHLPGTFLRINISHPLWGM